MEAIVFNTSYRKSIKITLDNVKSLKTHGRLKTVVFHNDRTYMACLRGIPESIIATSSSKRIIKLSDVEVVLE